MLALLLVVGIILVVLWALGLIRGRTLSGGLHVLLVIAIILIIIWVVVAVL
jgi:hypothetical protein